jgi:multisubunit Na+/H+ antiporter MnhF subunit
MLESIELTMLIKFWIICKAELRHFLSYKLAWTAKKNMFYDFLVKFPFLSLFRVIDYRIYCNIRVSRQFYSFIGISSVYCKIIGFVRILSFYWNESVCYNIIVVLEWIGFAVKLSIFYIFCKIMNFNYRNRALIQKNFLFYKKASF